MTPSKVFTFKKTQKNLAVLSVNRTFVGMKETKKRHFSSLTLLVVFLPMLVLSSLHIHSDVHPEESKCNECVHHLPHAGHIGSQTFCSFDCVLCQFLNLPFLTAATIVFSVFQILSVVSFCHDSQCVVLEVKGNRCWRAPPERS